MLTERRLMNLQRRRSIRAMPHRKTALGSIAGYYLVVPHTKERHFIAASFWGTVQRLNASCTKHLSDVAPDYWVDRSIGLLVDGTPGWINIDQTDALLDAEAALYQ